MAFVTKEDGIRDFNNHDAAGFFGYIDSMVINTDFSLKRIPKNPNDPGPLALNSDWKMVPAYVNGYVDAYNLKYHKITQSTYAVTEAAKNNFPNTIPAELKDIGVAISDNTGIKKPPVVVNPVTGAMSTPAQASVDLNKAAAGTSQVMGTSWPWYYYAIVGVVIVFGWWWFKKRRRK